MDSRTTRPVRRRRRTMGLAALAAAGVLASACSPKGAETPTAGVVTASQNVNETTSTDTPAPGGRLVYGVPAETSSFNPLLAMWASYSMTIARSIYDTLATYDENGVARPDLAESITPNADSTAWTITLRPGVTFSNGKPVTAAVVVAGQKAAKASPVLSDAFVRIADWEVRDERTFVVKMTQSWTSFPAFLASQVGVVADPDWLNSTDILHPIGTGPFVVDRWDVDSQMVLRRNPHYWRKDARGAALPYLDGITYKVIPDESARTAALRSGDIDVMMQNYATPSVATLIDEAKAGKFQAFDDTQFEGPEDYVLTNTSKGVLADVDARRALAAALDLDDYAKTVTGGLDTPADGPWKPGSPWYTPVDYPKHDLAAAKRLVDAVKARNGGQFAVHVLGNPSNESTRVLQWLKEQWAAAGVDVTVETTAQQTKIIRMLQGDYDLVLTQQFDNPHPYNELVYMENAGKPANSLTLDFSRVNDPTLNQLAVRAAGASGAAEKEAYAAISRRLAEVVPFIWLAHASRTVIAQSDVVNLVRASLPDGEAGLQFVQGSHPVYQIWLRK